MNEPHRRIIDLWADGVPCAEIAKESGVSLGHAYRVIRKYLGGKDPELEQWRKSIADSNERYLAALRQSGQRF